MKPNFTVIRWTALLEGSSLIILLFVAMPLKYYAGLPEAVKIVGPVHGVLFLGFLFLLFAHAGKRDINVVNTAAGFVASFVPFGTFIFKAKVLKSATQSYPQGWHACEVSNDN